MTSLRPLESRLVARGAATAAPPPCFLVGPPRSGTTLLYQLLVRRFRVAYLSNLAHRLYETPVSATRIGWPLVRNWRGEFESRYGHVAGWAAPNEGGWIWERWLPGSESLDASFAAGLPLDEMRGTVSALSQIMGGPFVNKNVEHSVRIPLLAEIFPGCGFIQVRREPLENVRSIVRAEQDGGGFKKDQWWSVKPRVWRRFAGQDAAMRAAAQVRYVHQDVENAANELGPGRLLRIDYERVCREPRAVADEMGRFLEAVGSPVQVRGALPETLELSASRPLDPEAEERLQSAVTTIWERA
jgi:hypothetical protein